jgi:hypothetical protein
MRISTQNNEEPFFDLEITIREVPDASSKKLTSRKVKQKRGGLLSPKIDPMTSPLVKPPRKTLIRQF